MECAPNVFYNVSQLLREPIGATRQYDIDESVALPYRGAPVARVTGALTLTRTLNGVLARADLAAEVSLECSRCLRATVQPLPHPIEEEYLPTVDPLTGGRVPEPVIPTSFLIDARHHLDLEEAVRQASVLAEPMAPLCRPDCRGLCPRCGADRNANPCECDTRPVDERWAALGGVLAAEC